MTAAATPLIDIQNESHDRVAALDLLRGLAALAVATAHFFSYKSIAPATAEIFAVLAVEVFFVLSGFVLAPQIVQCVRAGDGRTLKIFLIRRWMRTVPPYVVALLCASVMFGQLLSGSFLLYLLYVQNLFTLAVTDYFPIAWSLSVEEWFYILFPIWLIALTATIAGRQSKRLVLCATLFIALFSCIRILFGDLDNWGIEVRRIVLFRVDSIAYGFLLYLLVQHLTFARVKRLILPILALFLATTALVAGITWHIADSGDAFSKQLYPFAAALFGMGAIAFFSSTERLVPETGVTRKLCLFLGRVSYPVYLFHFIGLALLQQRTAALPTVGAFAIYLGGLLLFCWIFHHGFERPILRVRPPMPR